MKNDTRSSAVVATILGLCFAAVGSTVARPADQWAQDVAEPERVAASGGIELGLSSGIVAIASGQSWGHSWPGLFVANRRGQVLFHPADDVGSPRVIGLFRRPAGLSYAASLLYVYDHETRRIWTVDLESEALTRRSLELGYRFEAPTHMAVSAQGLLAVTEGSQLIFLREGHEPIRYDVSRFREPIGLVFSSWDTVQVLDRSRKSLVTITFNRLRGGGLHFRSETEARIEGFHSRNWRVMTAFEGAVYLADDSQVFAYLAPDDLLIPVMPIHPEHQGISQLAVTRESLFTLDAGHLDRVPRPQPVDLSLEGGAESNQEVLVDFYTYLNDRGMLPVRTIQARLDHPRLEELLLKEGILLVPNLDQPVGGIRMLHGGFDAAQQKKPRQRAESDSGRWDELLCRLNPGLCRVASGALLQAEVEQGTELTVPDLRIESRLSRERILVEGSSLGSYLERLVISPQYRRRALRPELIRRLNPNLEEVLDEEIFELSWGSFVVPVEKWTVTAVVPAADYADRDSILWRLVDGSRTASIFSRVAFVENAAKSSQEPTDPESSDEGAAEAPVPPPEHDAACAALRQSRDAWLRAIKYPLSGDRERSLWPPVWQADVRIGVVERDSTVLKSHEVFCLDQERPTWYTARDLDFFPQPEPASFDSPGQIVEDTETYFTDSHHGTHVAALIAGRRGPCWSGLVPSAKLVLIDLTDGADVRVAILDAYDVDTKVFNISQTLSGAQVELHDTIEQARRTLFVAAAGNSSKNLDDHPHDVPVPVRWGAAHNVVVVAASDARGTILPPISTPRGPRQGSNYGKRFVDIVAPGERIVSATAQRKFGPATGTSQAAPQVTAAAALLVGQWEVVIDGVHYQGPQLDPGDAKARLIATADWRADYEGKVWGGLLNFRSAVMFAERNRLRTVSGAALGRLHTFTPANDPAVVIRGRPLYYARKGQGKTAPKAISFSRILSLKRQPSGRYRVVLKEPRTNQLKILLNAEIADERTTFRNRPVKIECSSFQVFDEGTGAFVPDDEGCAEGLSVLQIEEYVRGDDYHIDWEEEL